MDYNILKKSIKFIDRNFPVEIFCEEEYKDYYIRGQVIELSSKDYFFLTRGAFTRYHFILFVLVRKEYINSIKFLKMLSSTPYNSDFCNFSDGSPEDFIYYQKQWESNSKNNQLGSNEFKGINNNPLISIKLKDAPIFENQYLKKSIEDEKDIILLDLSVHINKWDSWQKYPEIQQNIKDIYNDCMSNCSTRIHSLCGYHLVDEEKSSEKSVYNWFDNLYEKIYWKLGYQYLDKHDFFRILSKYGHLSREKIFSASEPIKYKKYIRLLSVCNKLWGNDICPLTRFCNSFFYDLIDDLKTSKVIGQCEHCGNYFKYRRNKKYCSKLFKYEGNKCVKQATDKKNYERHKEERRRNARKNIQETRKDIKNLEGKVWIDNKNKTLN